MALALWMLTLLLMQIAPAERVIACDLHAGSNAAALQACIDAAPAGIVIDLPPSRYVLERPVIIRKPVTLRTRGLTARGAVCRETPDSCARLVAAPEFAGDNGLVQIERTRDVLLEHLVLDGNRSERLDSPAASACRGGHNRSGFNAVSAGCVSCGLHDLVSQRALCGTGFEWDGARATIAFSTFRDNGDASSRLLWADGLTALYAPDSRITDNLFADNSDIGLIVGHGARSLIARNHITQHRQHAFAALMLDNFNSEDLESRGDFRGAMVTANRIDCGTYGCGFGIELGPHPWYQSRNIVGAEVTGNLISGAGVGINIDGAGTPGSPVVVYANTIRMVNETTPFPLCGRTYHSSPLDIAPDAVVSRRQDTAVPALTRDWHGCQRR